MEQFVKRRRMYSNARVKLLSRANVDHMYTHLMHDSARKGLITTGSVCVCVCTCVCVYVCL